MDTFSCFPTLIYDITLRSTQVQKMTDIRNFQILVLIVTIYVANVESQSDGVQKNTTSETQDIAKAQTGNPEAQALNIEEPNPTDNIGPAKPRRRIPPRGRKLKRRPRKRRPPTKNGQMNANDGKTASPGASSKDERAKKEQIVSKSVAEVPVKEAIKTFSNEASAKSGSAGVNTQPAAVDERKTVVETQPATILEAQPAPAVETKPAAAVAAPAPAVESRATAKPVVDDFGFGQDLFFWGETTTVPQDMNQPPPDFSVVKKPKKKVIPQVDTENSKAYDGRPCNETFKSHETDQTKYMVKDADGFWETLKCAPNLGTGLVWRQDLCSCGEELVAQDPNDWCAQLGYNPHLENRHKYLRKDHGINAVKSCPASLVWSQEKCLCIHDPVVKERPIENQVTFVCKTILQMPFEGNLKNVAEGYHVQPVTLKRRGKLPRIRYRKVPGSTEKAAMIVSQPLEFLAFRGNDFQSQVTYSLNFKISPRHESRSNFMVLITDECIAGGQNKARNASIRLAFQPNTKTFRLQFRTEKSEIDQLIKGALPDTYGWYKVVVYFEDNTLNMEVGGQKVFQQKEVLGKIPQNKCPLYIAGRGRGFDRSLDFYGYLDNVNLVKDCKFHEANIKFL